MADETTDQLNMWETKEGGFFTDGEITVRESRFGYDSTYQNGNVCLLIQKWEIMDEEDPEKRFKQQLISIGDGWKPVDNGKKVTREKARQFDKNSKYGRWIDAVVALGGEALTYLQGVGASPTDATIWENTKWVVETLELPVRNLKDGQRIPTYFAPTDFLGVDEKKAAGKGAAKKSSAAKADVKPKANAWDDEDADTLKEFAGFAAAADTHDGFIEKVSEEYEVPDWALDEGETGFYATHKA